MVKGLVNEYDEPWQETETFLRLLPGPRFARPPTDDCGVVIRHYSTTVTRADAAAVPHPLEWGRREGP